jgi:hypothetical protein
MEWLYWIVGIIGIASFLVSAYSLTLSIKDYRQTKQKYKEEKARAKRFGRYFRVVRKERK